MRRIALVNQKAGIGEGDDCQQEGIEPMRNRTFGQILTGFRITISAIVDGEIKSSDV
jgi:hypothetical protein